MKSKIILFFTILFLLCTSYGFTKTLQKFTSLEVAFIEAKNENKLLFVQYGRPACGNCKNLKNLIKGNKLKLPYNEFVYVDLNCDKEKSKTEFRSKFNVDGRMLPFVVIAAPDGTQLAESTGFQNKSGYNRLIKKAKANYKVNVTTDIETGQDKNKDKKSINDIKKLLSQ